MDGAKKSAIRHDIIAISGFAGSGKNTVAHKLAQILSWRVVEPTFKDLASREGITLEEFQKKAGLDHNIDKKFDEELKLQCKGGKCVVATWLGPWMAPGNPYRAWLDVPLEVRAKRVAGREGWSVSRALEHVKLRDMQNIERYKKVYGIDIADHSSFGIVLKIEGETPEEIAQKIANAYEKSKQENGKRKINEA